MRRVSRNHFLILRDGHILDLRSRYGTTVNAEPLMFGSADIILRSGDVIGLANTGAMIFWRSEALEPPGYGQGLGEGWGLLIDGSARRITRLTDAPLYLELDGDGAVTTTTERSSAAFALLDRNDAGEFLITATREEPALVVVDRLDSYHNGPWVLGRDESFPIELRGIEERHPNTVSDVEGAQRGVFSFDGKCFEIIVDVPSENQAMSEAVDPTATRH